MKEVEKRPLAVLTDNSILNGSKKMINCNENALEVDVNFISPEDSYSHVVALYSPKQTMPTDYKWINSSPTHITVND